MFVDTFDKTAYKNVVKSNDEDVALFLDFLRNYAQTVDSDCSDVIDGLTKLESVAIIPEGGKDSIIAAGFEWGQ
jgi:hypothetical protein